MMYITRLLSRIIYYSCYVCRWKERRLVAEFFHHFAQSRAFYWPTTPTVWQTVQRTSTMNE
jgi:phage-related protein